jgi:hypothetical protein
MVVFILTALVGFQLGMAHDMEASAHMDQDHDQAMPQQAAGYRMESAKPEMNPKKNPAPISLKQYFSELSAIDLTIHRNTQIASESMTEEIREIPFHGVYRSPHVA